MRHSERLERIPPYLFAQLERKIAEKRAAGIDVITLAIGDPDTLTFQPIVEAAQRAVANPSTHTYPSNRGREEFREAVASFYGRRFGVNLDHDGEVMPAIGAKECIFNLNLAFLDPTDVALAADPGYPVYTGGPLLAGAEAVQLAGAAALSPLLDSYKVEMNVIYQRRRDLVCEALAKIGVEVKPPRGTIYIWAPVPAGFDSAAAYCEHVLEEAAVVLSPGGAYGANGEGYFRISLTTPDDRLTEAVERLGMLAR